MSVLVRLVCWLGECGEESYERLRRGRARANDSWLRTCGAGGGGTNARTAQRSACNCRTSPSPSTYQAEQCLLAVVRVCGW